MSSYALSCGVMLDITSLCMYIVSLRCCLHADKDYTSHLSADLKVTVFTARRICIVRFQRDATQSAVLLRQVVCLSLCDIYVSWSHRLE